MKVLVTGAGGLLGARLVDHLLAAGHGVVALVRPGAAQVPTTATRRDDLERIEVDLTSFDPAGLPGGIDAVISLAQSSRYRQFPNSAVEVFSVNVAANMRLLEWARHGAVRRFVIASSGGVHGRHGRAMGGSGSRSPAEATLDFYLATKLCAELLFEGYAPFIPTAVVLRPYFIFGPGQRGEMLIPRLINSVRTGQPIQLQGPDGLRMNPIYVDDAAAAFAAALNLVGFHALDVGGPDALSLRQIAEEIGRQVGRPPVYEHRPGLPTDFVASIDGVRAKLGAPGTPFKKGLALTLART